MMSLLTVTPSAVAQQTDTLAINIYYHQGQSDFDPDFRSNPADIGRLTSVLGAGADLNIRRITIVSSASPEGNTLFNQRLSDDRSATARSLLSFIPLDSALVSVSSIGIDWQGLSALLASSSLQYAREAIDIIDSTPEWIVRGGVVAGGRKKRLRELHDNVLWQNMERDLFPDLRVSRISVIYDRLSPLLPDTLSADTIVSAGPAVVDAQPAVSQTSVVVDLAPDTPVRADYARPVMALRSNLLFDVLAVPDLGVEFNLGRGWTVGADAFYAWWNRSDLSRVWRWQGGELYTKKYFGRRARPMMSGWFAGAYAQILRYDVLLGSSGSLSGGSGAGFFDHPTLGGGLMVGYTLSLSSRFSLDFTLGAGYLTGRYQKYDRADGLNVWKSTLTRHFFGPTKAEIALVWFLWKGGRQ